MQLDSLCPGWPYGHGFDRRKPETLDVASYAFVSQNPNNTIFPPQKTGTAMAIPAVPVAPALASTCAWWAGFEQLSFTMPSVLYRA